MIHPLCGWWFCSWLPGPLKAPRFWLLPCKLCDMQRGLSLIAQPPGWLVLTTAKGTELSQRCYEGVRGRTRRRLEMSITKKEIKQKAVGVTPKDPAHLCWEMECEEQDVLHLFVTSRAWSQEEGMWGGGADMPVTSQLHRGQRSFSICHAADLKNVLERDGGRQWKRGTEWER